MRAIMDSWIFQGGHPVVTRRRRASGAVSLRQQRFRYLPAPADADARWEVPVLARRTSGEHGRVLLTDASASLALGGSGAAVVNAGGWGVFRTRYSRELFAAADRPLRRARPHRALQPGQRHVGHGAGRPGAGRRLPRSRRRSSGTNATRACGRRRSTGSAPCYRAAAAAPGRGVSAWVRELIGPVFVDLGWEPAPASSDGAAKLRGLLLNALGHDRRRRRHPGRGPGLARRAAGRPSGRPRRTCSAPSSPSWPGWAARAEYETFWDRIRNAATPQEEVRYLFRLASFPDAKLLQRTLDATLTEIRAQNGAFVIASGLANLRPGATAWAWLTSHWDDALKRVPDNSHGRMLEGIVRLIDPPVGQRGRRVPRRSPDPERPLQVDQLLERQRVNAAFAERESAALVQRFS